MGFLPTVKKFCERFAGILTGLFPPPPFASEFPIHSLTAFNLQGLWCSPLLSRWIFRSALKVFKMHATESKSISRKQQQFDMLDKIARHADQ
jgi:hypothetical protein